MVTKSRVPQVKAQCGCGAMIAPLGQRMHETSNLHKAWFATQVVPEPEPVVEPLDEEQLNILAFARGYPDPRDVAKQVRRLFSRREWPDADHPDGVGEWLVEHNIPIINLLAHMTPDDARIHVAAELDRLKTAGWGKNWEVR